LWRNARNRKLAIREQIDGPATLNQKLWQAGVYPTATKKKIDDWMRLGEGGTLVSDGAADSATPLVGRGAETINEMVVEMIKGVRNFVADYLI
jgi:hypothetical protein